jgi:pseudouridine-5'-phosphate glycosidase
MPDRLPDNLSVKPEVARAIAARRPVVALESTVISHGLPYPRNLDLARRMEEAVRAAGAVPATVAILDGRIRVGLDDEDLERLATEPDVRKVSRRDMPIALATGRPGATTVAGTMIAAELAGIRVFATGGIGGVHRGVAETWDVSADLPEIACSDVAVVSAGAKSILDLPKTLEALETAGVPVVGWKTDEFPAFFVRSSGLKLVHRADGAEEVASMMRAATEVGLRGGMLVAVPVPAEAEADSEAVQAATEAALEAAKREGVGGKDLTPYLLREIAGRTGGESLAANRALVVHNASVASAIAVAFAGTPVVPSLR